MKYSIDPRFTLAAAFAAALFSAPTLPQLKADSLTGEYEVVPNWPHPWSQQGYIWGSHAAVFAESEDRVYLAIRGELRLPDTPPSGFPGFWGFFGERALSVPNPEPRNCIVAVDRNGNRIESWTQWDHLWAANAKKPGATLGPHSIKISPYDPDRHVWIVDESGQQILEFTHDGKDLVMALGEKGVAGSDEKHFGQPQDIAWFSDGTILIADGLTNSRIVKFDKTGKYLAAWGSKGSGPGQLSGPHSIATDANRHVYVADRGNHRIQVFNENGKYLAEWPNLAFPNSILITAGQEVWVADGTDGYSPSALTTHTRLLKYSVNGRLLSWWGAYGTEPGTFWENHSISADPQGNFYVADSYTGRTQKFRPKPGADRSKLVAAPLPLMGKASQ
jgi:NHL repeat-containing protein